MASQNEVPLTLKTYQRLKQRIMTLQFRPGEILMVQSLSKELGISRTPVREALVRLRQEGFVEEAEGKKFRVLELSIKSVLELHELRELIEGHAVKQVALSRTEGQIAELRDLTRRMEQALESGEPDKFFEADLGFHSTIIRFCGNRALEELAMQLNEKIQRIRFLTLYVHRRLEVTIDEHGKILENIMKKDASGAKKALDTHLRNVKKGVERLYKGKNLNLLRSPYLPTPTASSRLSRS